MLRPLPYHVAMRDYLRAAEPELWAWFASAEASANHAESLRLELLKSTYRLDATGHAELHGHAAEASARLGLDVPVAFYQAGDSPQPNAAICYSPAEAHIIFSGPVLTLLNPAELRALIGHELAHCLLWRTEDASFHIADRMLDAAAQDARATPAHFESARRYRLYTEVYADRGALAAADDLPSVVASLVKIQTGLAQASGESYIRQADEIFEKEEATTNMLSHPEAFIRARALSQWHVDPSTADAAARHMIEGPDRMDTLDLPGQQRLADVTRRLVAQILRPAWMRTEPVLGHARLFFSDAAPAAADDDSLWTEAAFTDPKLQEYLAYVLLDFATSDASLDTAPLAAALRMAGRLGIAPVLEKAAAKELKLGQRQMKRLRAEAAAQPTETSEEPAS